VTNLLAAHLTCVVLFCSSNDDDDDDDVVLLGVMTAKLLVAFLRCFDDEFAAVRAETCIACSRLRLRDDQVLTKLASLIGDDPIHRVKALAIQGLAYYITFAG